MTNTEKRQKLEEIIAEKIPPAHCNSCDEWLCEQVPGQDEKNVKEMLDAIWAEVTSWEKK